MKVDLDETVHRVIGVVPRERRREPHRDARRVHHTRDEDVCRRHGPHHGLVGELPRPLYAERREPRAYKVNINKYIRLDGEKGKHVEPSVVHRAELRVILVHIAAQSVYDDQKSEDAQQHCRRTEKFALCESALPYAHRSFFSPTLSRPPSPMILPLTPEIKSHFPPPPSSPPEKRDGTALPFRSSHHIHPTHPHFQLLRNGSTHTLNSSTTDPTPLKIQRQKEKT